MAPGDGGGRLVAVGGAVGGVLQGVAGLLHVAPKTGHGVAGGGEEGAEDGGDDDGDEFHGNGSWLVMRRVSIFGADATF